MSCLHISGDIYCNCEVSRGRLLLYAMDEGLYEGRVLGTDGPRSSAGVKPELKHGLDSIPPLQRGEGGISGSIRLIF